MTTRTTAWPTGTPCWVDLASDDTSTARAFYGALFGWEILDSAPEYGGYLMATLGGRNVCGIGPKQGGPGSSPSVWTTYIAADDAAAVLAAGTTAGGTFMMDPMEVPGLGIMTIGADPTGAMFGVWQALAHNGFGVSGEPGAVVWNELHTPGYAEAKAFYAATFGVTFTEMGDGADFQYSTIGVEGTDGPGGDGVGGVMHDTHLPEGAPPFWLTYFAVADVDATVATATAHGASVLMPAEDTPYGRMATLGGPEGEVFSVMTPMPSAPPAD